MALTKKDIQQIKGIVVEAIEPFAQSVQKEFQRIDKRFNGIDNRFDGVDRRLDGIDGRFDTLEADVLELKTTLRDFMSKVDELITIYRKQEMELASLASHVARLEKRIEVLEKKGK